MTGRVKAGQIVMLGPSADSMGGMAAVVNAYRQAGLFANWPVTYIDTHREVGSISKALLALSAMGRVVWLAVKGNLQGFHLHVALRTSFWRKSLFMLIARLVGRPYIVHMHGANFDEFYERECGPVKQRYIRFCLQGCAAVIVLSDSWKHWAEGAFAGANIRRLYNPVRIPEVTAQESVDPVSSLVLFLGQLGERKGVTDLLRAFATVRMRLPDVRLTCGGDGDQQKYRRLAAELAMGDAVEFPGWVVGSAKQQLMERAACFCLPSYHEGLPMAVLEAMAAGIPIVATRVGGIPEAVADGQEGFLIEPGDVPALASALSKLLSDIPACRAMGARARAKATKLFDDRSIVDELSSIYAELGFVP